MKAYYEDVWAELPEDPEPWAFERRRALLLGEARAGERVLDLGCGAGRFVAALREAGADPVGVELAEGALERARRNVPGADLRALGPDGAIPLEDASVDLVWCSEVLEHVPDTAGLLSEARRVLKTGGRLLVTTPSHDLPRRLLIALARFDAHFDPLGQHVRFYSRRSLARVLETFAFEDVAGARAAGHARRPRAQGAAGLAALRLQRPRRLEVVRRAACPTPDRGRRRRGTRRPRRAGR